MYFDQHKHLQQSISLACSVDESVAFEAANAAMCVVRASARMTALNAQHGYREFARQYADVLDMEMPLEDPGSDEGSDDCRRAVHREDLLESKESSV